jgi:hypothetical protein
MGENGSLKVRENDVSPGESGHFGIIIARSARDPGRGVRGYKTSALGFVPGLNVAFAGALVLSFPLVPNSVKSNSGYL